MPSPKPASFSRQMGSLRLTSGSSPLWAGGGCSAQHNHVESEGGVQRRKPLEREDSHCTRCGLAIEFRPYCSNLRREARRDQVHVRGNCLVKIGVERHQGLLEPLKSEPDVVVLASECQLRSREDQFWRAL